MYAQYKTFRPDHSLIPDLNHTNMNTPAAVDKFPHVQAEFHAIAGGHAEYPRSLPSAFSTCAHVTAVLAARSRSIHNNNNNKKTPTPSKVVVYLNFGLLHLLHVHPHRPWELRNSSRLARKAYHYADFPGFLNLENWWENRYTTCIVLYCCVRTSEYDFMLVYLTCF
jgi:hypothetical protein